jgi:Chondroitinase B
MQDNPLDPRILKIDPRAAEAIARFEATKNKKTPRVISQSIKKPIQKKTRFIWRTIIASFGMGLFGVLLAVWVTGLTPRALYSRALGSQLAWSSARYPTAKPLWTALKIPLENIDADVEKDILIQSNHSDRHFPALAKSGAGLPVQSLQAIVKYAKSGDTITLPDGRYRDCAVITQDRLTLIAAHPGKAVIDGGVCEGKAALVTRGNFLIVDGLLFKNMRVPDGNGAGIRHEKGILFIKNATFYNNQNGILTHAGEDIELEVSNSIFARNGSCAGQGGCAHSIYVGEIKKVSVINSQFSLASGGHFLKSRARSTQVLNSNFNDKDGIASYLIDLSFGSAGEIRNNSFHKGLNARNRLCIIRNGAEGTQHASADLAITENQATSDLPATIFVYNDTKKKILVRDNKFTGTIFTAKGPSRNQ